MKTRSPQGRPCAVPDRSRVLRPALALLTLLLLSAGGGRPAAAATGEAVVLTPRVIAVGKWAEGIADDGTDLWVAESGRRSIARLDLARGRVLGHVAVGRLPVDMATIGGAVFTMVATDKRIQVQSGGKGRTLATLDECPQAMIADGAALWVLTLPACSSESGRLVRVDPQSGRRVRSDVLGEWPQALAAWQGEIWVAHVRAPALTIVNQGTMAFDTVAVDGASFWSIAAAAQGIYVGGRVDGSDHDGLVVKFDPAIRSETARAAVPELVTRIIADQDHVIAAGAQGTIWVLGARDLALQRTITLSTGPFEPHALMARGRDLLVVAGQYQGENGAVFVLGDYLP